MLTASFFKENRRKLRVLLPKNALIIVTANGLMQRNGDMPYPFRQESNFYYLTGLHVPEALLVSSNDREFLIVPPRSEAEVTFGGTLSSNDITATSGIERVYQSKTGWKELDALLNARKDVYTLLAPPAKISHTDTFYTNPARRRLHSKLRRRYPSIKVHSLNYELTTMRQVKTEAEISLIKEAISITAEGIKKCKKEIVTGNSGHELQQILHNLFFAKKADHAFSPITVSGPDTCVLHSTNTGRVFAKNDLVLLDIGAEYSLYAADISRTFSTGKLTTRQKDVHDAVRYVQTKVIKLLQPGIDWKQLYLETEEIMGEQLKQLGLIQSTSRKDVRKYFPHAIGHSLGLDAHDACDYMKPLQANMIVTVEPGIYIPEEGIGIRIEDDILITSSGAKNLSSYIPYL
jgi:Xaa-Pro aminopeptidase